jgi:glucose dehydrogenase
VNRQRPGTRLGPALPRTKGKVVRPSVADAMSHGAVLWRYAPPLVSAAAGVACCDQVNRDAAFADGHLFFDTLDNQTIAVDAATGAEL